MRGQRAYDLKGQLLGGSGQGTLCKSRSHPTTRKGVEAFRTTISKGLALHGWSLFRWGTALRSRCPYSVAPRAAVARTLRPPDVVKTQRVQGLNRDLTYPYLSEQRINTGHCGTPRDASGQPHLEIQPGRAHRAAMSEVDPFLPVEDAAQRLGVSVETVLRYARRNKWPKVKGNDGGTRVAVPLEAFSRTVKTPQEQASPPPAPDLAAVVQAAVAPLQALLERSDGDRRTLQKQSDDLRAQLAAIQVERADAVGLARTERARREEIEKRAADLQRQLDADRQRAAKRRWWHFS